MANSPARAAVDVGSVIADTYKIEALLGRGGMGAVFLASHKRLAGKHVAIKILHTELEDTDVVARFKREAEIAARLNHPNIVGVIDYNVAPDGTPYLVLDYLEGETLAQRIARGPVPLDQVLSIVRQIGSALAAAHRAGIIHRDLKPQNIFLVPTEVDGRMVEIAKVLDFGISKIRGSQTVKTQDSALLGTPQYMAPEQATGQHAQVDERTDVFALGAIVYEMLSGQPAFSGASIPEVVFKVVYEQPAPLAERAPSVPPEIAAAVARAMAKQADERLATVSAFVEAITGQPLTLSRGPVPVPAGAAESPSAARRVATGEAFAQTMGSGDHGESPFVPIPEMAAADAMRTLGPPTIDAPAAPASGAPAVTTVDLHAPRRGQGSPPRRSTGVIAAIALAGAALAAGAMYVAMRDHGPTDREPPSDRRPDDPRAATATPGDPRTPAPKAPDHKAADPAAAGSNAAVPSAAGSAAPKAADHTASDPAEHGHPSPGPGSGHKDRGSTHRPAAPNATPGAGSAETEGDEDARDKLAQAAAAFDRHDYDLAERLANAVINSSAATVRQRATARMIHGTVQCAARNDQEAAQIDLRNLDGFRGLRARLIGVCRSYGILTGP